MLPAALLCSQGNTVIDTPGSEGRGQHSLCPEELGCESHSNSHLVLMTWIKILQLQRDLRIQETLWAIIWCLPAHVSVESLWMSFNLPLPSLFHLHPPTSPNSDPLSILLGSDWPLLCGTPAVRFPDRCLDWGECWQVSPYNKIIRSFKAQLYSPLHISGIMWQRVSFC